MPDVSQPAKTNPSARFGFLAKGCNRLHSVVLAILSVVFIMGLYLQAQQAPFVSSSVGQQVPLPEVLATYFPKQTLAYWELRPDLLPAEQSAWLAHPWQLPPAIQGLVQAIKPKPLLLKQQLLKALLKQQNNSNIVYFGLVLQNNGEQTKASLEQVWVLSGTAASLKALNFRGLTLCDEVTRSDYTLWEHPKTQLWATPLSNKRLLLTSSSRILQAYLVKEKKRSPALTSGGLHVPSSVLQAFEQNKLSGHVAVRGLLNSQAFLQQLSQSPSATLAGQSGLAGRLLNSALGQRLPWLTFHLQAATRQAKSPRLAVFYPVALSPQKEKTQLSISKKPLSSTAMPASASSLQVPLTLKMSGFNTLLQTAFSPQASSATPPASTEMALLQHLLPLLGLNWNDDVLGLFSGNTTLLVPSLSSGSISMQEKPFAKSVTAAPSCSPEAFIQPRLWLACPPEQWPLLVLDGGQAQTEKLNRILKALALWQQDKLEIKTSENRLGQFIQLRFAPKKAPAALLTGTLFAPPKPQDKKKSLKNSSLPLSSASPTVALADTGSQLLLGSQAKVEQLLNAYLKESTPSAPSTLKDSSTKAPASPVLTYTPFTFEGVYIAQPKSLRYTFQSEWSQEPQGLWLNVTLPH